MRFGTLIPIFPLALVSPDDMEDFTLDAVAAAEPQIAPDFVFTSNQEDAQAVVAWVDVDYVLSNPSAIVLMASLLHEIHGSDIDLAVALSGEIPQDHPSAPLIEIALDGLFTVVSEGSFAAALLGFQWAAYSGLPYKEYLKTIQWEMKRKAAREAAGERCQLCNAGDRILHVHHRTYERRGMELPEDLIVLCAHCHAKFHDKLPRRDGT